MIKLTQIDETNFLECFALRLDNGQERFVSSPIRSLAQAYVYRDQCMPFGIYAGDKMIGYVMVIYDREEQTYNIWHFMIDAAHQRKGYGKAALAQVIRYIKTKPFGPSGTVLLTCSPENQAAYALYTDFGFCPTGRCDGKEQELCLKLAPGAAEYGDKSIIRQQKTRPAGRIYFGCGRVFIVEKPPVLHMRAKPCITGMRARWHKYGPPAAKILLPAARKRAYSSIVRCFPALFSSIRF